MMMMKRKKKKRNKTQEKWVMYNEIVHHPLTHAHLIPEQWSAPSIQLPPFYMLNMMFCCTE